VWKLQHFWSLLAAERGDGSCAIPTSMHSDARSAGAPPAGFEHLAAHRRPFTIESDWDAGYFVIVDGERRREWFASFVDAANAVTAPCLAPPARNIFDAAYATGLNTYLDFDGERYVVGVGTSFGQRNGESQTLGDLATATRWIDSAIARALRPKVTTEDDNARRDEVMRADQPCAVSTGNPTNRA
jgi:hypothetical protein